MFMHRRLLTPIDRRYTYSLDAHIYTHIVRSASHHKRRKDMQSTRISIYLSTLSIASSYLSVYLPIYLSILSICLAIYPSS